MRKNTKAAVKPFKAANKSSKEKLHLEKFCYRISEAGYITGLDDSTIYELIRQGIWACTQLTDGRKGIPAKWLHQWLEARTYYPKDILERKCGS